MSVIREVRALSQYRDLGERIKRSRYSDILHRGYMLMHDVLTDEQCKIAHVSTKNSFDKIVANVGAQRLRAVAEFGCVRSPFVEVPLFRDLLLHTIIAETCEAYFPCGHILHLNRSVVDGGSKDLGDPSPTELHRDIPYFYTPTLFPMSLSFLYFFCDSDRPQLSIVPDSHDVKFYNREVDLHPIPTRAGSLLIFNSSLLHCALPSTAEVSYSLYMFTSPVIKQVVDFSSPAVVGRIKALHYRLPEVLALVGSNFLAPVDDECLLARKFSRIEKEVNFYKTGAT